MPPRLCTIFSIKIMRGSLKPDIPIPRTYLFKMNLKCSGGVPKNGIQSVQVSGTLQTPIPNLLINHLLLASIKNPQTFRTCC